MAQTEIFVLSIENREHLKENFDLIKCKIIEEFASKVAQDATVSINRPLRKTLETFNHRKVLNVHERLLIQYPELDEAARNEKLRQEQPNFYQKRMAVDNFFVEGGSFKYGALNIGNLGAYSDAYGNLCIVIRKDELKKYKIAYLKADSLQFYVADPDIVNIDEIKVDLACGESYHFLASIKHHTEIGENNKHEWPDILCSSNVYIEAIIRNDVLVAHFEEIRIKQQDYSRYNDLFFKLLSGNMSNVDKVEAGIFLELKKQMKLHNINFKHV